jgi:hypothetical protein
MKATNAAGAQTECGGAGPVRGLLGGKDLTGRLFSWRTIKEPSVLLFLDFFAAGEEI